jgi:hypothetical protein
MVAHPLAVVKSHSVPDDTSSLDICVTNLSELDHGPHYHNTSRASRHNIVQAAVFFSVGFGAQYCVLSTLGAKLGQF